jgi:hypothetical protein
MGGKSKPMPKPKKGGKSKGKTPKTATEIALAKLAKPYNKLTYADIIAGRRKSKK